MQLLSIVVGGVSVACLGTAAVVAVPHDVRSFRASQELRDPSPQRKKEKTDSQITPTPKRMGLSTPRSGGGGVAQGHPNQSGSARSTTKIGMSLEWSLDLCCDWLIAFSVVQKSPRWLVSGAPWRITAPKMNHTMCQLLR